MTQHTTAIIILNWNGKQLLEQFLPALLQHSAGAVIYIADNASTDNSIAFIREHYPSIKIIQNDQNYGFAQGYNEALKSVEEEYYVLLNSDIEVTPNWLTDPIALFETEPLTAIVQPKILDFKDKSYFEYAGAGGGYLDKYGIPYCRGRILNTLEKDTGQYNDTTEIFWASGACFFIRKSVYRELGGFDNDFFAHQEEIDLCWRAFNKGYKINYCGSATVYHVGGATLKTGSSQKTFLNFRNSLYMLVKNLPKHQLFPTLFMRLVQDGPIGILFLLQGKPSHLWAILRAHYYFYRNFMQNYKKRGTFQSEKYYTIKSIVYRYYFKNGKVFDNQN